MKALTLVLCILALLGSGASGFFWWQIGNTKKELQQQLSSEQSRAASLQTNLNETNTQLEQKVAQLTQTDTELGDTKSKLTAAEARNVQISREIATLKTAYAAKDESEKKLNADVDALRRELVQTRLAAQVGNPEEIERYKQTIASLESRLGEIQGIPPAAAGASASAGPVRSERTAAARVAVVGTKNAFVILELGSADGIVAGNKFNLTRAGELLAESVISEVKDTYAIAQIAPSSIKGALKEGDIASFVP
jgi:chromosome segregation ATPase